MGVGLAVALVAALMAIALAGGIAMDGRRQRAAQPISPASRALLEERLPLYGRMPQELRARLDGLIGRFLRQVSFVGCDDLQVTDEMRLTIAAQACLLVVNKPNRWYRRLRSVLIYPSAFRARVEEAEDDGYVVSSFDDVRTGESWEHGPIVLSWRDAIAGAGDAEDGVNVVLPAFAHHLDAQSGVVDGAPLLDPGHDAARWARVFSDAYERLFAEAEAGRETLIDPYGASAPEEFFAVAVETFFEEPAALQRAEPALYDELAAYFRLDPATWRRP